MGTRFFKTNECVDYYNDGEIAHALAVEDRLKKRIGEIKNLSHDVKTDDLWSWEAITEELKKILEGEK